MRSVSWVVIARLQPSVGGALVSFWAGACVPSGPLCMCQTLASLKRLVGVARLACLHASLSPRLPLDLESKQVDYHLGKAM